MEAEELAGLGRWQFLYSHNSVIAQHLGAKPLANTHFNSLTQNILDLILCEPLRKPRKSSLAANVLSLADSIVCY